MADARPTLTSLTLLFTDIEGSTSMWVEHPEAASDAIELHDRIVDAAIVGHGGTVIKTTGDGFLASFPTPRGGLDAAVEAQLGLAREAEHLLESAHVRMALHVGTVEERRGDLFGLAVNRCQRVMSIAKAGQILLSSSAAAVVRDTLPPEASLRDLGEQQLRSLPEPERVYQLVHPDLRRDFPAPETTIGVRRKLPVELSSFIGREREVARVRELVEQHPLVTLTGGGGAGKTRLAVEVADGLVESFSDGVWFIGLESVTEPALVAERFATELELDEREGTSHLDIVVEHLRDRSVLLVVDNCEHVVEACVEVVSSILRAGSPAHILATSRERLAVAGEVNYRVPSLTLPDEDDDLAAATSSEAVELFADRARRSSPDFEVTVGNVDAIARIARQLDGIPLAIELAAAKVAALTPGQIADHLDDRLNLLAGGERTAATRHRTLRAAMAWSYELLSQDERRVLDVLSVFKDGFDLAACEAVCADANAEDSVVTSLTGLVEKSLVVSEVNLDRYRLLETVRQYAEERLRAAGGFDAAAGRHARYFMDLAETAGPELDGPDQGVWLRTLDRERDNLRSAFEWMIANGEAGALRLASAIWRFWLFTRRPAEGREWLERSLDAYAGTDDEWHLRGLVGSGMLAAYQGDQSVARARLDTAFVLAEELGNAEMAAASLLALALLHHRDGDLPMATSTIREALVRARTAGDAVHTSRILSNLALLLEDQGYVDEATRCAVEALEVSYTTSLPDLIADALLTSGELAMNHGEDERARELLEDALRYGEETHLDSIIAWAKAYLGKLRLQSEDSRAAQAMLGEAVELFQEMKSPMGEEWALRHLALAEMAGGQIETAGDSAIRALKLAAEYVRPDTPHVLFVAAKMLRDAGQYRHAAQVMNAGVKLAEGMDLRLGPADKQHWDAVRRDIARHVGDDRWGEDGDWTGSVGHDAAVQNTLDLLVAIQGSHWPN